MPVPNHDVHPSSSTLQVPQTKCLVMRAGNYSSSVRKNCDCVCIDVSEVHYEMALTRIASAKRNTLSSPLYKDIALGGEIVTEFGTIGYCFGDRYTFDLAFNNVIKCAVVAHLLLLTVPNDLEITPIIFKALEWGISSRGGVQAGVCERLLSLVGRVEPSGIVAHCQSPPVQRPPADSTLLDILHQSKSTSPYNSCENDRFFPAEAQAKAD
ncbi:uncharacterized protein EDB91DRAFT_1347503 [Suillus paluster]|uniref:uncharacterized protein n=1 Tax=Suillus paluster TaxID=48578 RepID=UPI001B882BD9|nr:uncharacterized protein EDB91DRAFT_1347503 [Suillus paluster]KAG1738874.1 hypothetical protein EDB91DRAFT_1347503 [Suillus paluster]